MTITNARLKRLAHADTDKIPDDLDALAAELVAVRNTIDGMLHRRETAIWAGDMPTRHHANYRLMIERKKRYILIGRFNQLERKAK